MNVFKILFALVLLSLASVAVAEEGVWYDSSTEGTTFPASFYSAASNGHDLCVWDMTNNAYRLISEHGKMAELSSINLSESNGTTDQRVCLTLVSDGNDYYSVELTACSDSTTTTFEKAGLYRIDFEHGTREWLSALDLSDVYVSQADGSQICLSCTRAKLSGDKLYLLFESAPETTAGLTFDTSLPERFLLVFQLGNETPMHVDLGPGADLIEVLGTQVMYALPVADSKDVQIMIVDLSNQKTLSGMVLSNGAGRPENFAFHLEANVLYYSIGGQVWEMTATGTSTLVASLPVRTPNGIFLLPDEQIGAWTSTKIAVSKINPELASALNELTVYGTNEYIDSFMLAHPEITITNYESTTSIMDALLTRSPKPDLLILNTYRDPETMDLMRQGYLQTLDSAIVRETVLQMYPEIVQAVTSGNEIVALPYGHTTQPMIGIDEQLWADLGLGELPNTWEDMLSFLEQWPALQRQHPEVRLFIEDTVAAENIGNWILSRLISDYECYRQGEGDSIGYDTEILRNLLSKYQAIDFDRLLADQSTASVQGLLMADYCATAQGNYFEGLRGLPLRVEENAPLYLSTMLDIIALNPYSENQDAGLALIEYVAEHLSPIVQTELMPNVNAPIRSESYSQNREALSEQVAIAQSNLDACEDEAARVQLEQQLAQAQANLNDYDLNAWDVSPESIAEYRAIAEHIYVCYIDNIDVAEEQAFSDTCARFLDGNLSMDQFIAELERRYVMRSMENG